MSGFPMRNAALDAQHGAHLIFGLRDLPRLGNHHQHVLARAGKQLPHGEVRDQDAQVLLARHGGGRPLHHADHLQLAAVHINHLADRILGGKKGFLQVGADYGNGQVMAVVRIAYKAAGPHHRASRGVRLLRAAHFEPVDVVSFIARVIGYFPVGPKDRDSRDPQPDSVPR